MANDEPHLRVGAHVLIQLGSELVTDVEQAILECVKNAYDADSPWCKIEIDTKEEGTLIERGVGKLQTFRQDTETVSVEIRKNGKPIEASAQVKPSEVLDRLLHYKGKITIEDQGTGLDADRIENSWLVISWSQKRSSDGVAKAKTKLGRTPLGDKGLGRLGSMRLGDSAMTR